MTDGHTEEIEVTDDVATFDELQKYEKKVERKEMRQPIFLKKLKDKGFDFPTLTEVLLTVSENIKRKCMKGKRKRSAEQN